MCVCFPESAKVCCSCLLSRLCMFFYQFDDRVHAASGIAFFHCADIRLPLIVQAYDLLGQYLRGDVFFLQDFCKALLFE